MFYLWERNLLFVLWRSYKKSEWQKLLLFFLLNTNFIHITNKIRTLNKNLGKHLSSSTSLLWSAGTALPLGASLWASQQGLQYLSSPFPGVPPAIKSLSLFMDGLQLVLLSDVWLTYTVKCLYNNGNEAMRPFYAGCQSVLPTQCWDQTSTLASCVQYLDTFQDC